MYGVDAKGEPCVTAVRDKEEEKRETAVGADGGDGETTVVGTDERGRPDGNNDTKLEEMRESVACAGCDADIDVEEEDGGGSGGEGVGSEVVDPVGKDIDGGDALPLRRGVSGRRAREGLGATLTLPPRSTRISFGLVISEASASASASSVDVGIGIGLEAVGGVKYEGGGGVE